METSSKPRLQEQFRAVCARIITASAQKNPIGAGFAISSVSINCTIHRSSVLPRSTPFSDGWQLGSR